MDIAYDYIEDHKLFIIKWVGLWDLKEYKKSVDSFLKETGEISVKQIIQDITDLDFNVNLIDLSKLVKIKKEKLKKSYRVVYITSKPQDVVFSHLYSNEFENQHSYMYCASIERAIYLLSLNISVSDLENRFALLKNNLLRNES